MPIKSQQQNKFMHSVAQGDIKVPSLSPETAKEFIAKTPTVSDLPKRIRKQRFGKLLKPKSDTPKPGDY